jgi:hypothetical protein
MEILLVSVSIILMIWLLFENYILRKRLNKLANRNEELEIEKLEREINRMLVDFIEDNKTERVNQQQT